MVSSSHCAVPTSHVTVFCHIWWFFYFFSSHLMVPSSHCVVLTSHVIVLLSHSVVPLFFLTFDDTIFTLCSTNITYDCTFITFCDSFIFFLTFDGIILILCNTNITYDCILPHMVVPSFFFSHLMVLSSHCVLPTSYVTVLLSHSVVPMRDRAPDPFYDVGPNPREWVESCYCLSKWRFY